MPRVVVLDDRIEDMIRPQSARALVANPTVVLFAVQLVQVEDIAEVVRDVDVRLESRNTHTKIAFVLLLTI